MPELRKDPVLGRWVIISVERGKRPTDFVLPFQRKKGGFCPFCPGNEYTTPPELMAFRKDGSQPNKPGWTLRVMSNKFPALEREGALNKKGEGIFDKMNGVGAHEVVVETPEHSLTLSTISPQAFEEVLWAYHARLTELKKDPRIRYVLIFKNEGDSAGASLEHSHTQLIALPIVPRTVKDEIQGAKNHYEHRERCLFCDIIHQELDDGRRVISENEDYIALAPYAPRAPFETWVLPKNHESAFGPRGDSFKGLAEIFQKVLKQIDRLLDMPAYNFMLHISPFNNEQNEYYHWHIELMPKLTKIAGFEWGSGFYINPTPPEEAAKYMREAKI
ncbi:MAG: galactose-1-phosphate uridylyltransferase [Thermodesulfovibrionales bacterium]